MDFVIFKNRDVQIREEEFGGIIQYKSKLFVLNNIEYSFLSNIEKYIQFSTLTDEEKRMAKTLIDNDILLKLEIEKAKEIIENSMNEQESPAPNNVYKALGNR